MNRTSGLRFSYVVAVHNEEAIIDKTVATLVARLSAFPGSRILLGENGSSDRSREICDRLAGTRDNVEVVSFTVPVAGLGYALERGLELALLAEEKKSESERDQHWVAFTAADLPFGFSDLDELLRNVEEGFTAGIVIGSKAHPGTHMKKSTTRVIATLGFRALRIAVLGMRTRDPQGTFFIRDSAARTLVGRVRGRNYFYTTELVHLAELSKIQIQEVPVAYAGEQRPSSVRIWKHGRQMAGQLLELRSRTGRARH